jgi:UDP-N-acetylmuramoyl-L-alanyl-D-glutamate--2,6-diaminopimelate ligase
MLGRVVERGTDMAVLTSAGQSQESPLEIVHDILDGFTKPARAHIIPSRDEAIRWAISEAETGDTVLLAGQGGQPADLELGLPDVHSDREIARRLLYELGQQSTADLCEARAATFPKLF